MPIDHTLRELYSVERIGQEVRRLGREISADYAEKEVLVIVVLKGAFMFAADLLREIRVPVTMDFVEIASYCGMDSVGKGTVVRSVKTPLQGRHVLVVEDIIDQGFCLANLLADLRHENPASIKVCTLIDNRRRRATDLEPDYAGIRCVCGFLVGYGLDMDQRYRELPALYEVVSSENGFNTK